METTWEEMTIKSVTKIFHKGMISYVILTVFLMVLGCAKQYIMIDRAVILNATANKITDVKVFHEPTKKSGEVNMILPQMTLDIGFAGKPLLAHQATVSWRDGAGVKGEVALTLPYDLIAAKEGRIMNLVYVIHSVFFNV